MVLCLFVYFLAVNFDWSIILIRKSFAASRHISGKLGVKLAIMCDIRQYNDEKSSGTKQTKIRFKSHHATDTSFLS